MYENKIELLSFLRNSFFPKYNFYNLLRSLPVDENGKLVELEKANIMKFEFADFRAENGISTFFVHWNSNFVITKVKFQSDIKIFWKKDVIKMVDNIGHELKFETKIITVKPLEIILEKNKYLKN